MLHQMEQLYAKADWIIADARAPGVDASEYVKRLSWRLLDKAPAEAPEAEDEGNSPF